MKYKAQKSCPCGDYEFTIVYTTESGKIDEFYCPACGHLIDDEIDMGDDEDRED